MPPIKVPEVAADRTKSRSPTRAALAMRLAASSCNPKIMPAPKLSALQCPLSLSAMRSMEAPANQRDFATHIAHAQFLHRQTELSLQPRAYFLRPYLHVSSKSAPACGIYAFSILFAQRLFQIELNLRNTNPPFGNPWSDSTCKNTQ